MRKASTYRRGQAAIEYFAIFAAILAFAVISAGKIWPQLVSSLQGTSVQGGAGDGFFQRAATALVEADQP